MPFYDHVIYKSSNYIKITTHSVYSLITWLFTSLNQVLFIQYLFAWSYLKKKTLLWWIWVVNIQTCQYLKATKMWFRVNKLHWQRDFRKLPGREWKEINILLNNISLVFQFYWNKETYHYSPPTFYVKPTASIILILYYNDIVLQSRSIYWVPYVFRILW